jgi:isopenicillin-N N-acyltransferase-like protein
MRIIVLEGPPYTRGEAHGRRLGEEIRAAVSALRETHGASAYAAAAGRAAEAWPLVIDRAPEVAAEIDGIADGAGANRIDILLRAGFEFFDSPPQSGCTALAVTTPGGALVAQNWDAPPEMTPELTLFLHIGADGFEAAIVASAGGLGWVGVNRHGLALVNNDLMLTPVAPGLPSQVVRRLALAAKDVPSAVAALAAAPHMGGRSYLLGDAAGRVAGVEVSAGAGVRINQSASPVLHTNHALDAAIAMDESPERLAATYPSSRHRLARLRAVLTPEAGVAEIARALADRDGYPDAIAKAPSAGEPTATLFSFIVECGARKLHLAAGAPDEHAYQSLAF